MGVSLCIFFFLLSFLSLRKIVATFVLFLGLKRFREVVWGEVVRPYLGKSKIVCCCDNPVPGPHPSALPAISPQI